jgi:hypothetical protein
MRERALWERISIFVPETGRGTSLQREYRFLLRKTISSGSEMLLFIIKNTIKKADHGSVSF